MRTINTIPPEEDAQRLAKACAQLRKVLVSMTSQAESLERKAEDKGDEYEYLNMKYRERALSMAIDAVTKSPEQLRRK